MAGRVAAICLLWVLLAVGGSGASSTGQPVWWESAQRRADDGGYHLITPEELAALITRQPGPLLVDVRPHYEYEQSTLAGAENLEVQISDKFKRKSALSESIKALIGPDTKRVVVFFCRSFR